MESAANCLVVGSTVTAFNFNVGVGVERLRGVGKGPDFGLMVVVVAVMVAVAWPVERGGALANIKVILRSEVPNFPPFFALLGTFPAFFLRVEIIKMILQLLKSSRGRSA